MSAIDIARKYVARGWAVIPVAHKKKKPYLNEWEQLRIAESELPNYFNGAPQNIGVLLGDPSGGLIDVDLDHPLALELADEYLPPTNAVFGRASNPRSHRLYYVTAPTATKPRRLPNQKEILRFGATGAQTVFPGSTHESGEPIEWVSDGEPTRIAPGALLALAEALADEVLRRLGETPAERAPAIERTTTTEPDDASLLLERAMQYAAAAPGAADGGRNNTAFNVAGHLASFVTESGVRLGEGEILSVMRSWNMKCSPALDDHELATSVRSALENGTPRADKVVERKKRKSRKSAAKQAAGDLRCTDMGNGERFVRQFGADARYCHPWGKWLCWDGTRWRIDDMGTADLWAKWTARRIWDEAAKADSTDKRSALGEHATASEHAARISAMLRLARSEPGLPVLPGDLDKNPWLLNVANGTLDLRTGKLRPHDRADLITKLCPVPFDPAAECKTWLATLNRIMADREGLVEYQRRFIGYCLTGSVQEQLLHIWHGAGSNGKSVLLGTLLALLGDDYAIKAAADLLVAKHGETHPTEKADLFGKRLVVSIEADDNRRLAESLVKDLTGGDRQRARRMREDFWEFNPTHKLILCTNHKPVVRGTDHAIWRRLALVPFDVIFWNPDKGETGEPELKADKRLPDKLRGELPGILAWAVQGCLAWQKDGLGEPAEVKAATASYRSEQDTIGLFIAACCWVDDAAHCKAAELYAAYRKWCEQSGELKYAMSQRRFGAAIRDKEFEDYTNNGVWYRGIQPVADE